MDIPTVWKNELANLLPASVISDISCFVFYDHHPKDDKNIDITVCTKSGELREYYQRDLQSSLNLNCVIKKPSELRILRNNNSELFYLISSVDVLFIVSGKEIPKIHKELTNIDRYDIGDPSCNGEAALKVIRKDDAVPILFDSNFEPLEDYYLNTEYDENSLPVVNELKRKMVEARYSTKKNEQMYAQYLNMHQRILLLHCKNQQTTNNSVFQDDNGGDLKLKTQKPWIKVCNNKLVIMVNVLLFGKQPIENLQILLHSQATPSLVYTSKIFTKISSPPHWHEPNNTRLTPDQEIAIAAVVELNEVIQNISRVELSGSLVYTHGQDGKEVLVPFDDVKVSSTEMMGDEIDVLSSASVDDQTLLAVLAATEKTQLCFRHIKDHNEPNCSLVDLFCTHLQMDRVENALNVIVHKKSPYHALNGTMMVFNERNSENGIPVSVHTRTHALVMVLLHHIHNTIPAKIIATTPSYRITAKTEDLCLFNEEIVPTRPKINCKEYAKSMLNRSVKILEHLDASLVKMSQSKDPLIRSKIGTHIDIFAGGVEDFKEFSETLKTEAAKGVDSLTNLEVMECLDAVESGTDSDVMVID